MDTDNESDVMRAAPNVLAAAIALLLPTFVSCNVAATSPAPVVTVMNCADAGPGSLRDAVINAAADETIDLSQLLCSKITLTTGAAVFPSAASTVTLIGSKTSRLTIDGGNHDRVFVHTATGALNIHDLTISHGSIVGSGGGCILSAGSVNLYDSTVTACTLIANGSSAAVGGGIRAAYFVSVLRSTVSDNHILATNAPAAGGGFYGQRGSGVTYSTISGNSIACSESFPCRGGGFFTGGSSDNYNSTISGNSAGNGAGVFFAGYARGTELTVSGNVASGAGGGLYASHHLSLIDCTIATNTAVFDFGAGVYLAGSESTTIDSSILGDNTSEDGLRESDLGGNLHAPIVGSNNIIMSSTLAVPGGTLTSDPKLAGLADNGGRYHTKTHALLRDSPAIDNGLLRSGILFDQRGPGFDRVADGDPDIGAFESGINDRIFLNGFDPVLPAILRRSSNR